MKPFSNKQSVLDNIEQEYERALLKERLLNVIAQLKNDEMYKKENAIEDLLEIIDKNRI